MDGGVRNHFGLVVMHNCMPHTHVVEKASFEPRSAQRDVQGQTETTHYTHKPKNETNRHTALIQKIHVFGKYMYFESTFLTEIDRTSIAKP